MAVIEFIIGKKKVEVTSEPGETILDAAIRSKLNPSYSCMEGVCATCIALVREGEVDFSDDTILGEKDTKAGKILTCQAKPAPGAVKIVIDYDAC